MQETIQSILVEIPSGCIFDTHTIIDKMLQEYSDVYLTNCQAKTTEAYHSQIAKLIDAFDGDILTRKGDSWSKNIRDKFSKCTCWQKK